MTLSEAEIQSQILLEASKRGHRLWRSNAGSIRTHHGGVVRLMPPGFPDTVGFRKDDGRFVVIEVKKPNTYLNKKQKKFRDMIIQHPVVYGVARSAQDMIDIIENGKKIYK